MGIRVVFVAVSMMIVGMSVPSAGAAKQVTAKPPSAAKETKYCIRYEDVTGSRVAGQECRTKADWARRGIDVGGSNKS